MPRVTCSFCGLPFSVRTVREGADYFCCSGCALASRIPIEGSQLPITRGLVLALAMGFGLFNQVLFAVVGGAVTAEGSPDVGVRLVWVSLAIGAALILLGTGCVLKAQPRNWTDAAAGLLSAAAAAWAGIAAARKEIPFAAWVVLAGNAWIVLWLSRGWVRRAWRRATGTGFGKTV